MLLKYKYSILVGLLIMYLSLSSSRTFDDIPLTNVPYIDKIVHFGMYFFLMLVMILETRKKLINITRFFILALFPLCYGIIIEILQIAITETRSGDFFDFLANATGTIACLFLWILMKPHPVR